MTDKWSPDAAVLAATGKQQKVAPVDALEELVPVDVVPVPSAGGATLTMAENIARIIHLDKQIEDTELATAALKQERALVEAALREQFVEAEIQNVKVLGRTIYLHRSVYCNVPAENMEQIVKVLDAEGLGDIAPRLASTAKIKGLLKEDEKKWSEKFEGLIKTGERYDIRNRSAS